MVVTLEMTQGSVKAEVEIIKPLSPATTSHMGCLHQLWALSLENGVLTGQKLQRELYELILDLQTHAVP